MAKKKKSKMKKILGAALLAGLGAAALRGRNKGVTADEGFLDVKPTTMNMDEMISMEAAKPIIPGDISNFTFAAKGGRMGYGKGGKVSRGCGKVMAGRSKKTKYF